MKNNAVEVMLSDFWGRVLKDAAPTPRSFRVKPAVSGPCDLLQNSQNQLNSITREPFFKTDHLGCSNIQVTIALGNTLTVTHERDQEPGPFLACTLAPCITEPRKLKLHLPMHLHQAGPLRGTQIQRTRQIHTALGKKWANQGGNHLCNEIEPWSDSLSFWQRDNLTEWSLVS